MRYRVLACTLLLAASAWWEQQGITRSEASRVHAIAYRLTTPDDVDAELMARLFAKIATYAGDSRPLRLNHPYDAKAVNVVVFDFAKAAAAGIPGPPGGVYSIRPNLLLVDSTFLKLLVLDVSNDLLGLVQTAATPGNEKLSEQDLQEQGQIYNALNARLRYANLTHPLQARAYAPVIEKIWSDQDIADVLMWPFVLPVAHELYHVRPAAMGWRSTLFPFDEETNADRWARQAASAALRAAQANAGDSTGVSVYADEASLDALKYLQAKILIASLEGLRGLETSSYLVALYHAPCELASLVPWPKRFDNPDVVVMGRLLPFPVLTESEFDHMRSVWKSFDSPLHGNLIERLMQFDAVLSEDPRFRQSAQNALYDTKVIDAVFRRESTARRLYRSDSEMSPTGASVSVTDLLKATGATQRFQRGAGCREGECGVALLRQGFLEIFAERGRVRQARLVQPNTDEGHQRLVSYLNVFFGPSKSEQVTRELSASLTSCGVASTAFTNNRFVAAVRTVNESGWLEFVVDVDTPSPPGPVSRQ